MQIKTFDHIKIELHKATRFEPDRDTYHIIGVNRRVSPDGKNEMIENFGIATYDNLADATITANKIADALGIDVEKKITDIFGVEI